MKITKILTSATQLNAIAKMIYMKWFQMTGTTYQLVLIWIQ